MNTLTKILFIWMMAINLLAKNKTMIDRNPDFRFPQTVSQNALRAYDKAIKAKDYNIALQALIQYALAETSRTDSAITEVMEMCETIYQKSDKPEYKVLVDHLRSRISRQDVASYHTRARQLADSIEIPARQIGENLLRADELGWRIIPTLSQYLRHWEYENRWKLGLQTDDQEYLTSWRSMMSDIDTEMYLEYKLIEMQYGAEQYASCKRYEATYPQSPFMPNCKNIIARYEQENVQIRHKAVVTSSEVIKVTLNMDNLHDCTLILYRLPDGIQKDKDDAYKVSDLVKVAETQVHADEGGIPVHGVEAKAAFAPQTYGKYVVLPTFVDKNGEYCIQDKIQISRWDKKIIIVTDLAAYTVHEAEETQLVVVDRKTGMPQKDVQIERNENTYRLTRGDDRYQDAAVLSKSYYQKPEDRNVAQIYTDLKIYRPGETLRGTVVVYRCGLETRKPLVGKKCTVKLLDVHGNEVCTMSDTLDAMGQIVFEMQIPEDRMNGSWSLNCETDREDDEWGSGRGYTRVEVSEYKLPTFSLDMSQTPSVQQRGNKGVVKGKAMTFTGMPVADAEVEMELSRNAWWWWRNDDSHFTTQRLTVKTDKEGCFVFDCPAEWMNVDNGRCYIYHAQVSCTNTAGERHDASCTFTVGKAEALILSGGDILLPADGKIRLPLEYRTSEKEDKPVKCHYRLVALTDTANVVKQGDLMSNDPSVDWSVVPSGQYRLMANIVDAEEVEETEMTLYRETDKVSPTDQMIWIPEPTRRMGKDGKTDIMIWTKGDCNIYCVVESRNKIEYVNPDATKDMQHWLLYGPGVHHLRVQMPEGLDEYLEFKMTSMLDGETFMNEFRVDSPKKERLQLVATSFRDKTCPGQSEKWTFRLTDAEGKPVKYARMMLEAYNKALKQLMPNDWRLRADYLTSRQCDVVPSGVGFIYTFLHANLKLMEECRPMLPKLWLYGQDFYGSGRVFRSSKVYMAKAYNNDAMEASMMYANAVAEESDTAMPESDAAMQDSDNEISENTSEMRTGDLHVALWEPRLTSDEDGNVSVTFDVPQQNATWVVQALAYNDMMSSGKWDGEVLVQRPLMVQPVLPRFVRQGDHVVLKAQVMNATDTEQQAQVVFELYDPRTGEVVQSASATVQSASPDCLIPAMGTHVVQLACDVPNNMPYIGVRVKATAADGSSDGEQQLLPVASNAQPVVETYPFYMQPDVTTLDKSLDTPNGNTPDKVTLEFCANPTWYCVKALPSMIDEDARTSITMAHSLFAIILADKIQGDSVSHQALYDKLITRLKSLQKQDGGFAWIDYENCVSSEWATSVVVELIGELHHLGCLTDEHPLMQMACLGIDYMERKAIEHGELMEKVKSDDYSSLMSFTYIRNLFMDVYPVSDKKIQKLMNKTIKSLCKTWGRSSLSDKAFIALTLNRMGEPKEARKVVESLRQFAITKPAKGMYWERLPDGFWFHPVAATSTILQAMAEVDPRTEELNMIRQWLLLEKQTSDWGSSSMTSDAVYALLSTGDDWLRDMSSHPFAVKVDGKVVEAEVEDQKMGYIRTELPADARNVHIERESGTPAWGAIFWEYVAPVTEIREAQLPEVSIRKSLLVKDADGKWVPATSLRVGQRVQVRLDVHADKALEYVTINDERPAMLEPVDQTSHYEWAMGEGYFHETKDRKTVLYIHRLRAGDHCYTYECDVTHEGTFSAGIATIQSQYAPQFTAHTGGSRQQSY